MTRNTRTFIDFDPTFEAHPTTGDLLIRTDERAIKFAVKSLVMTQNFERPFHPELGTPIYRLLFDNFDDMFVITLRQAVTDVISIYEPRVTVMDVTVVPSYDNNSVSISIQFKIKNTERPLNVDVTLERTR